MSIYIVFVTVIASLLSGLIGVLLSFKFYERLEKRKLKVETAKKLIGSRYDTGSIDFRTALNEIFVVYADSQEVMKAMESFWEVLQTPLESRSSNLADDRLLLLLKEVCADAGITHPKHFNDAFFMRTFGATN